LVAIISGSLIDGTRLYTSIGADWRVKRVKEVYVKHLSDSDVPEITINAGNVAFELQP
jgi:hypothetical protein